MLAHPVISKRNSLLDQLPAFKRPAYNLSLARHWPISRSSTRASSEPLLPTTSAVLSVSTDHNTASLMDLPNELLLSIAESLAVEPTPNDLNNFLLTNRRLATLCSPLLLKLAVGFETSEGSVLHWASVKGQIHVVKALLAAGLSPLSLNRTHATPVHKAAANGHDAVINVLLSWPRGLESITMHDALGDTPLLLASQGGHVAAIQTLLDHQSDVNGVNQLPSDSSEGEQINWSLLDPIEGSTPLHRAAQYGHLEAVKLLLERGANLHAADVSGDTPFLRAAQQGRDDVLEYLLSIDDDLAKNEWSTHGHRSALHRACESGHLSTSRLLLSHGASVNARDFEGQTPLHRAAHAGHAEVAKLLLEEWKANLEARTTNTRETPLHFSFGLHSGGGGVKTSKVLLENGAHIDSRIVMGLLKYSTRVFDSEKRKKQHTRAFSV